MALARAAIVHQLMFPEVFFVIHVVIFFKYIFENILVVRNASHHHNPFLLSLQNACFFPKE